MMTYKVVNEYRINKKGSECFRTRSLEEAKEKLAELNSKRPVYTLQTRSARVDKYGVYEQDWLGRVAWGIWD